MDKEQDIKKSFIVEFGKVLRELRKSKSMSIEEVAFKAGIDSQNLRKYELGQQEMRIGMLKRISQALSIDISDLMKGL